MFYTVDYVPGMVRLLLACFRHGALDTTTFELRPGALPLSVAIVRPGSRDLAVRVHPTAGLLSLFDGNDDRAETLLRKDPDFAALLYAVVGKMRDKTRQFYVDFDRVVMARTYSTPVPELHCAADFPWKVLDPRSRRMLVCNRKFNDYSVDDFPVEHAVSRDDASSLSDMPVPDPTETLLFACMAASAKCVAHLVGRAKVTADMYDALVATSLNTAGAVKCALHMVSSPGGELPSADAVQKMARAFGPSAFRDVYDALMVRKEWGWA